MIQFWLVERTSDDGVRNIVFCTAEGREKAKYVANTFLLGNPDDYVVTPISEPNEIVKMKINIGLVSYI